MIERLIRWLWRLLFGGRYQFPRKSQKGRHQKDLYDPQFGFVYQIFHGDTLLYVGRAKRFPFTRLAEHIYKPWFPTAATVYVTRYQSLAAACEMEEELIRVLRPRYNKVRYAEGRLTMPEEQLVPTGYYTITVGGPKV